MEEDTVKLRLLHQIPGQIFHSFYQSYSDIDGPVRGDKTSELRTAELVKRFVSLPLLSNQGSEYLDALKQFNLHQIYGYIYFYKNYLDKI